MAFANDPILTIGDNTVTTAMLQNEVVVDAKIAALAISEPKYKANSVSFRAISTGPWTIPPWNSLWDTAAPPNAARYRTEPGIIRMRGRALKNGSTSLIIATLPTPPPYDQHFIVGSFNGPFLVIVSSTDGSIFCLNDPGANIRFDGISIVTN